MKQTVTSAYTMERAFRDMGRDDYTVEAYEALLNYYEDLESDTGEEIELDVIAICGDWTEYDATELQSEFDYLFSDDDDKDTDTLIELIQMETYVIELSDSWLVAAF